MPRQVPRSGPPAPRQPLQYRGLRGVRSTRMVLSMRSDQRDDLSGAGAYAQCDAVPQDGMFLLLETTSGFGAVPRLEGKVVK